jgi:hypothetical protein
MPLQAAIVHKRTYMHMFPLAKKNLNELFDHDPPTGKDYTPKDEIARHRWNEFTVLLGALNYIHTDRPSEADFHIDLKVS